MRKKTITFLERFRAASPSLDANTFGFWPYDRRTEPPSLVEQLFSIVLRGPVLGGNRVPINMDFFPRELAIPSDADVTGTVYAALLDNAILDDGRMPSNVISRFYSDWRDLGQVPRRLNPSWLPSQSGAFLTWLNYQPPESDPFPNDVDLAVNATVLFALGRYGLLETPGCEQAVGLINEATRLGLHRTHPEEISDYYPDNYAFHYFVSRAYREGGVDGLRPAAELLADTIEAEAIDDGAGCIHWDKGAPHLNTAFAILTLLNTGRYGALTDGGAAYLEKEQDPQLGGWDEGVFFVARLEGGQEVCWVSAAFTTAMALEALCQYEMSGCASPRTLRLSVNSSIEADVSAFR